MKNLYCGNNLYFCARNNSKGMKEKLKGRLGIKNIEIINTRIKKIMNNLKILDIKTPKKCMENKNYFLNTKILLKI